MNTINQQTLLGSQTHTRRNILKFGAAALGLGASNTLMPGANLLQAQTINAPKQDTPASIEADAQKVLNSISKVQASRTEYVQKRNALQAEMINNKEFIQGMETDKEHGLPVISQRELKVFSKYSALDRDLKQQYINSAKAFTKLIEGFSDERKLEIYSFLAQKDLEKQIAADPKLEDQKSELIKKAVSNYESFAEDQKDLSSMRLAEGDFDKAFTKHNVITGKDGKHFAPYTFLYSSKDSRTIKPGDVGKRLELVQDPNDPNLSGLRQNAYRFTIQKTPDGENPFAISVRFNYQASELINEAKGTKSFKVGYQHGDRPHSYDVNIVGDRFTDFIEMPHKETHLKEEGPNGPIYNDTNASVAVFLLPTEGYGAGFFDVEK